MEHLIARRGALGTIDLRPLNGHSAALIVTIDRWKINGDVLHASGMSVDGAWACQFWRQGAPTVPVPRSVISPIKYTVALSFINSSSVALDLSGQKVHCAHILAKRLQLDCPMAISRDLRRFDPLLVALLLLAAQHWLMICTLELENEATCDEIGYTYIWGHIGALMEYENRQRRRAVAYR